MCRLLAGDKFSIVEENVSETCSKCEEKKIRLEMTKAYIVQSQINMLFFRFPGRFCKVLIAVLFRYRSSRYYFFFWFRSAMKLLDLFLKLKLLYCIFLKIYTSKTQNYFFISAWQYVFSKQFVRKLLWRFFA